MPSALEEVSRATGGGGVAVVGNTNLTQTKTPISLGKTSGPGTNVFLYLNTEKDPAYNGATIQFYVNMQGFKVLWDELTFSAADIAAQTNTVALTGGAAAEAWEVYIILAGSAVPKAPLRTSLIAFGVEIEGGAGGTPSGNLTFQGTFVGPGAGMTVGFNAPGLNDSTTYAVTVMARVQSSAVDPVGATFSSEAVFAWENVAGIVSLVPVILSAPNTSSDAALAATATSVGATGGQATVTFALPGTLDPTTHTEVTIELIPLGSV